MSVSRPNLAQLDPAVRQYIEYLEAELARSRAIQAIQARKPRPVPALAFSSDETEASLPPLETEEAPTSVHLIAITGGGLAKRTPRHLYSRQRRGGMGIFDLDGPEDDPVRILLTSEPDRHLLLFTNLARAFRLPVSQIVEGPVRSKGQSIVGKWGLLEDEYFVAALPDEASGAVALLSQDGFVRYLRHHVFGEYMKPGTAMYDARKFGSLATVCRTRGDADLLIVSHHGKGIRFAEKLVPPQGGLGLRLESGDRAVAVASINDGSNVFLADAQGRGTIRVMGSFSANKSAGGGGKIIMNSTEIVAALPVECSDDIFMISRLSKIVRFMAAEVPPKEGNVQGVNCMSLRGDEVVTATASG
ncbi:MAG: DNA gyrase C-terminal beta-propeller domain-containing protein [Chloroflexota bacterium]